MHSNLFYRAFLLMIFLVALWYTVIAAYRYHSYFKLTDQVRVNSIEWDVKEVADDEFYLEARYTFVVKDRSFSGKTSWPTEFYRNRWAAEKDQPYFTKQYRVVWYDQNNPDHSSLQKKFPFKECISAIFLWALLLYFLWLGYYVTKFKI